MEINRLSGYSDFLGIVEYPAVVFCEDGEVLSINNAAVKIVGSDVESIAMEPDKFMVSDEFWPTLDDKKAIIWHRLGLIVNDKDRYVVSGFVNQFEYGDKKAYMVLFELRSDVTIGSVSLERVYGERDTYLRTYLSMDIQMAISTVGWWDSATCSLRVIMIF